MVDLKIVVYHVSRLMWTLQSTPLRLLLTCILVLGVHQYQYQVFLKHLHIHMLVDGISFCMVRSKKKASEVLYLLVHFLCTLIMAHSALHHDVI
jgi:hypothetical protein